MVLESLVDPFIAEHKPMRLFLLGAVYSSIAIFLSLWIFGDYSSLVAVFLTVIACVPLLYKTIKYEAQKDFNYDNEKKLLFEHSKAFTFLMFLFAGSTLAYTLWYVILPSSLVSTVFGVQTQTIININQNVVGHVSQLSIFSKILLNNIKVLVFCIIFSFVYGAGAIFILIWNASVIGAAMGNFIRTGIAEFASSVGFGKVGGYFFVISMGLLRYSIHGIPEILAYVVGGLAGGLISVALIKHTWGTKKFEKTILDASDLIIIAVGILFIAALLEVYITPLFF